MHTDHMQPSSEFRVARGTDTVPRILRWGDGQFTDLFSSTKDTEAPIVVGTWSPDDRENDKVEFIAEVDEVKYVTRGKSLWRDVVSGREWHADAGSVIWLPKGSRTILVQCRDLVAFYVEAIHRNVEEHVPEFKQAVVQELLAKMQQRYIEKNVKSGEVYQNAKQVLAGGNTRSALHYGPFPLVIASGHGCHVTSVDGDEYLDVVSEFSACMLGHSHPEIAKVVHEVMARGINLGAASTEEVHLASLLTERIPSMERLRFANSGTEANTMALTVARNFTKRSKILAFTKGYHGGFIGFSDVILASTVPFEFVVARYNDVEHARSLVDSTFAAIIVEPMQSVGGMIPGNQAFLQALREIATTTGAVLIFDEIVTSRLGYGALQSKLGIIPDMTTIGKFWGGGFSFGAFGGRADIMSVLDPATGAIGHSGTFNNNAFSMTAGAVACKLITREGIEEANALGDRLRDGINQAGKLCQGEPLIRATGIGSMIGLHFRTPEVQDGFFFFMADHGVYVARRGLMALNLTHKAEHVTKILDLVRAFTEALLTITIG